MGVRLVCLALAAAAFPPVAALGAQSLRYAGREGQLDRYRLTNTVKIHQEFQGAVTDLTVRSRSLLRLTLEHSDADTLTYAVSFDSLDFKLEGAPVPAPDLSCLVGEKMTLKLSPKGRVYGFETPAGMCAMPAGFDLKQLVGNFFPRLPQGRATAGTAWSDTIAYSVSQQGMASDVRVITNYTSKGQMGAGDGTFIEVDYGTLTTVKGKGEQGGAPLFLEGTGKGSGTVRFVPDGGTFWSSTGTQTFELVVDVTPEGQPPRSIPIRQEVTAEIQHL